MPQLCYRSGFGAFPEVLPSLPALPSRRDAYIISYFRIIFLLCLRADLGLRVDLRLHLRSLLCMLLRLRLRLRCGGVACKNWLVRMPYACACHLVFLWRLCGCALALSAPALPSALVGAPARETARGLVLGLAAAPARACALTMKLSRCSGCGAWDVRVRVRLRLRPRLRLSEVPGIPRIFSETSYGALAILLGAAQRDCNDSPATSQEALGFLWCGPVIPRAPPKIPSAPP